MRQISLATPTTALRDRIPTPHNTPYDSGLSRPTQLSQCDLRQTNIQTLGPRKHIPTASNKTARLREDDALARRVAYARVQRNTHAFTHKPALPNVKRITRVEICILASVRKTSRARSAASEKSPHTHATSTQPHTPRILALLAGPMNKCETN